MIAQDAEEAGVMEEVMVTGIRRSLSDSAAIKRDADGVVDALSAEDIGKFPDTNLAEAMSRITGVSIDRTSPGGPPGEGQRITVRGIGPDYNLVLLNGRQMPGATILDTDPSSSRAFDFSNLASEAVSGVDVYKTSMANIPTGGIGATVNIRTARPLDIGERAMSFGAKGVYDDSTQDASWTPEVSGIYSDVFADGKFGIALTGIYQDREFGANQANTSDGWRFIPAGGGGWGELNPGSNPADIINDPRPDSLYGVPQHLRYSIQDIERQRTNGQLVMQWRPVENFTATLDYTYSELEIETRRSETSVWFNFGPSASEWTDGPV
ncbi:MAG TPA: TonB-dependent receptor plug domain-containing protein, partial [Xanthomonadales bacterium]|nr:TonB-dependent receptor plug domain-containing protein [Xanthomonadales bacterium]